MELKKAKKMK